MSEEQKKPIVSQENAADAPDMPKVTTQTAPKTKPPKRKPLPRFKLILHNDDFNLVDDVVRIVVKLVGLTLQEARERTKEADRTGVALLLVTHKERAELYQEQFRSMRLTTTIEPDA
jgi:ATP-dependent Clp protease adaptor protein ClpS